MLKKLVDAALETPSVVAMAKIKLVMGDGPTAPKLMMRPLRSALEL
jgi:hypothetical protein